MSPLAGPFMAAAALLAVGGLPKLRRPGPTARALSAMRLPASSLVVRVLGAVEVVIAAGALLRGDRVFAALVAASYVGFTVVVGIALLRGGALSSCGCFGRADTPPTRTHLAVSAAAAVVGTLVVAAPVGGLPAMVVGDPAVALPLLFLSGCTVWFAYLALVLLPALSPAAVRVAAGGSR